MSLWTAGLLLVAALVAAPRSGLAQATPALPSAVELRAAAPLLDRGVVAVVHPSSGSSQASVLLLARAKAPASAVYRAVAEPERYPEFMPAMQQVDVTGRRGNAIAYTWLWKVSAVPWRGSCAMAVGPPADAAVRITKSDLGTGSLRWHFYDQGHGRSVVAESVTFDLAKGHSILRWLMRRGSAMPEAVTLTVSTVLLEGSRRGASPQAKRGARGSPPSTPREPTGLSDEAVKGLGPLLRRGAVVLLETDRSGALDEVVVAEATKRPGAAVLKALHDPRGWARAVPVIERLEVTAESGDTVDVRLSMNLSVLRITGTARITRRLDGIDLQGTGGDLQTARLRLRVGPAPGGGTVLQSAGRTDLAQSSFFLRRLIRREPTFAHGFNSSAQLLFVRGLLSEAR